MRTVRFLVIILLVSFAGCVHATEPVEKKEGTYAPVEASLCHINQKVASHFLISGIPDGFNEAQYKEAVKEICYSNPVCKSQAETIFNSYGISVRKIDDMFSVMLCDKEMNWKIMEDFSCNNMRVEVQSWRMPNKVPCRFEDNWQRIKEENCK
jgi:hypothetical protein